jgi:hypothetical protein
MGANAGPPLQRRPIGHYERQRSSLAPESRAKRPAKHPGPIWAKCA